MTGYGKAVRDYQDKTLTVELRGLNSKSLDLNCRMPALLAEKELDMRQLIAARLERGKVDMTVSIVDRPLSLKDRCAEGPATPEGLTPINAEAFKFYYKQLSELQAELGIPASADLVGAVMRLPAVTKAESQEVAATLDPALAQLVMEALTEAIDAFDAFRTQEGAALQAMFEDKLTAIENLKAEVEPLEKGRVEHIREHLLSNLDKLAEETKERIDSNRLEQEMIYYLEKLDITEEKVRLTNHIKYFRETMSGDGTGVGKKLGFIAQEMGREINTLGSKSNQSEMQIIVVKMKDLLEQIKEQVLNVL